MKHLFWLFGLSKLEFKLLNYLYKELLVINYCGELNSVLKYTGFVVFQGSHYKNVNNLTNCCSAMKIADIKEKKTD